MNMPKKPNIIPAIETVYRQYKFRSRLEAKWAAFFDLCGWSWSYEPIDLKGWIPDFAIGETPTMVEVKPFFKEAQWAGVIQQVNRSTWEEDVVMLGADPSRFGIDNYNDGLQIGWVYQRDYPDQIVTLHFGRTEGNGLLGLCPMEAGWTNYIWEPRGDLAYANKWSRVLMREDEHEEEIVKRWARATNTARWMKNEL